MFLPVISVNGGTPRLVRGGSSGHQYQRKFDIQIPLIGGYILLQHADQCPVSPFNLTWGNWVMAYMELGLYTQEFPHFLHDFGGEVGSVVRVGP